MNSLTLTKNRFLLSLVLFLFGSLSLATVSADVLVTRGLGISGYDPVAYFTAGQATKGDKAFQLRHEGVTYQFSSAGNRDKFKKNPSKYLPQYGGYCAYALAEGGGKVAVNPKRFKIVDQKLYLFYDRGIGGNTLKKWNKAGDDKGQIAKANKRWAEVKN